MRISRRKAIVALPLLASAAQAQPTSTPAKRIGLLIAGDNDELRATSEEIVARLAALGWKPGSVVVDGVHADGNSDRLPALADDLARRVDVIVSGGMLTTLVAARATQTVPIVFRNVHYPIEQGFAQSYARPGRNVTGPALYPGLELTVKPLEFLHEVAPAAARLAFVSPRDLFELPTVSGAPNDLRPAIAKAAGVLGFETRFYNVPAREQLDTLFAAVVDGGAQAIYGGIPGAPEPIVEFTLRQRLPSLYPLRYFVEAGGLMSYGPREADTRRSTEHAVPYIDRILRGAVAAEVPIEQPSRFEFALNAKTARSIGTVLPQSLVLRADVVVR